MKLTAADIILKQRDGFLIPDQDVQITGPAAYGESEATGLAVPQGFNVWLYANPAGFCIETAPGGSGDQVHLTGGPIPDPEGASDTVDGPCPTRA